MNALGDETDENVLTSEPFQEAIRSAIALSKGHHAQFGIVGLSLEWNDIHYIFDNRRFHLLPGRQAICDSPHPLVELAFNYHGGEWEDPRRTVLRGGIGKTWADHDLVDSRKFDRSPLVNELLDPAGCRHILGGAFPVDRSHILMVGIMRSRSAGEFEESTKKTLAPHFEMLRRSVALALKFNQFAIIDQPGIELQNHLGSGIFFIDSRRQVKSTNDPGLLSTNGSGPFRIRNNCLEPRDSRKLSLFNSMLNEVAKDLSSLKTRSMILETPTERYSVLLCPLATLTGSLANESATVVVFANPLNRKGGNLGAIWAELFGLTKAEALLATKLVDGDELSQISEKMRLSRETLKTQVKSLFNKTGTSRQATLIRLLLSAVSIKVK